MKTKKKKSSRHESLNQSDLSDLTSLIRNGTIKIKNLPTKKKIVRKR